MGRLGRVAGAGMVLVLLATACTSADDTVAPPATVTPSPVSTPTPTPSPTPTGSPTPSATPTPAESPAPTRRSSPTPNPPSPEPTSAVPSLRLRRVVTVNGPVAMATRPNDQALYLVEQRGRIVRVAGGSTATVLDIRGSVSTGNEQGLLGLAFSPDGSKLYINYTDTGGDTRLVEYGFSASRKAVDRRELLRVDQPYSNHNGGMVAFGPDGYLYTSLGDGGSAGDPQGNAQSLDTLLGKILRIDPRPAGGDAYRIPSGNPFVGRSGRDEIWAYGLRNPWRFSFDAKRGDMWIGDVGQGAWEEIDFQRAGRGGLNYGWDRYEGRHRYEGSGLSNHTPPVHEYANDSDTCAVTGGYVYRGARMPGLQGWYLFADFCEGRVKRMRRTTSGSVSNAIDTGLRASLITSFGEGPDGELYVLSREGPVYRVEPR